MTLDPLSKATYLSARARRLFEELLSAPKMPIGAASPSAKNGVYAFSLGDEIIYVGEAAGSSGLQDRILRKHVSGDEGHALQAEFCDQFPDRLERRAYIKASIQVQWIEIPDSLEVSVVEKLAIAVLEPRLNQSVVRRTVR